MNEQNLPIKHPQQKLLSIVIAVLVVVLLGMAAVFAWLYHPYFEEQRAVEVGEERRAILNTLPENPAAKDLIFEEREQLLQNLSTPGE